MLLCVVGRDTLRLSLPTPHLLPEISRDKDDLMWLAVGVRNVRIVRIVRTGGYGGAAPVKGGVNRPPSRNKQNPGSLPSYLPCVSPVKAPVTNWIQNFA